MRRPKKSERGVALVLAIIVIFLLTVLGLALLFSTSTEVQLAGAETTVNKTFYAADSGAQYGIYEVKATRFSPDSSQACTSPTSYFCFNVPERSTSGTDRAMTVQVTPIQLINEVHGGGGTAGAGDISQGSQNKVVTREYAFTATSTDSTLNSTKSVYVITQVGPIPE